MRKRKLKENPALTPSVKRHNAIHDQATLLLNNIDAITAVNERVVLDDLPRDADVLRLALRETANKVRDLRIGVEVQSKRYVDETNRLMKQISNDRSEASATIEALKAALKVLLK